MQSSLAPLLSTCHIQFSSKSYWLQYQNTSQNLSSSHKHHTCASVPFHHYLLPEFFTEVSLTVLPFLLLPGSSFNLNTEARIILLKQQSDCIILLFQILPWLFSGLQVPHLPSGSLPPIPNHISFGSSSCLLCTRPHCCFSNQISTLLSQGLRHAVFSAWNTFPGALTSKILPEPVQVPVYQWSLSWTPLYTSNIPNPLILFHPALFVSSLICYIFLVYLIVFCFSD